MQFSPRVPSAGWAGDQRPTHAISHVSDICLAQGQAKALWPGAHPHLLALSEQMSLASWSSLNHSLNYGSLATGLALLHQVLEMEKRKGGRLGSYFQWLKTPASLVPCLDKES